MPNKNPERGFTLMDVLVAILVMSIGVAGLLAMQITSVNANARAREILEAAQLAQDKVEELRLGPPLLPAAPVGGEVVDARGCRIAGDVRPFCAALVPGMRYARTWRINGATPNQFEVTTCWVTPPGCVPSCNAPGTSACTLHTTRVSYVR